MKKLLLLAVSTALCSLHAQAQSQTQVLKQKLSLKPGPEEGEDAIVMTTHGCQPSGYPGIPENLTGGNGTEIQIATWTFNSGGCNEGTIRSVIRFRKLNTLPDSAVISKATLYLYGIPNGLNPPGNSTYPNSPYPNSNESWVRRITSGWAENTISWSTKPTATPINQAVLPVTTQQWNQNATVDVTNLVKDIIASGSNEGFELLLQKEEVHRSQYYATSDYPDSTKWPELTVEYDMPQLSISNPNANVLRMNGVAPNPTKTEWTASITAATTTKAEVGLYDLMGRMIDRYPVMLQKGANRISVAAQLLPAGTYLLRVTAAGNTALQTAVVKY